MFQDNLKRLVAETEGGVAGLLMGFDGIAVESYAHEGFTGALADVQTLAMEFAHVVAQARRTVKSLDAGALQEMTLRTDTLTLIVHVLNQEYFLACAILPTASLGKARYLLRVTAPHLTADL